MSARHGFVVDIDKDSLAEAPKHDRGNEPVYDATFGMMVNSHYGVA